MARKHFTQGWVNQQRPPKSGKNYFWDDEVAGLGIVFGKTKTSYVFQRLHVIDGKRTSRREVIGPHRVLTDSEAVERHGAAVVDAARAAGTYQELRAAEWTLEQARARARELKQTYTATGGSIPTLQTAVTEYLETMRRRERSAIWMRQLPAEITRYCSDWLRRRIDTITPAEVQDRHEHVTDNHGPYVANRVMRALRAVLNRCLKRHALIGKVANPFLAVEWNAEKSAQLLTDDAALPRMVAVILEQPDDIRVYRLTQLLTGGRPDAVEKLRWENVHLDQAALGFASDKTGAYSVPICDFLVELLREYRASPLTSDDELFPHLLSNGHRRRVPGLPPPKDWRKYFRTAGKVEGVSDVDLNRLCNHGKRTKTGLIGADHYEFAGLDYYRPLVERVARRILRIAKLSSA